MFRVATFGMGVALYTRSIMKVSRIRFTHSRQNGTLAESRSEEGSLTGGAFHDRSTTPDALIFPILIKFGERGYLECQKHRSQS